MASDKTVHNSNNDQPLQQSSADIASSDLSINVPYRRHVSRDSLDSVPGPHSGHTGATDRDTEENSFRPSFYADEKHSAIGTSKPADHLILRPSSVSGQSAPPHIPQLHTSSSFQPLETTCIGPTHTYSLFQNSVEGPPDETEISNGLSQAQMMGTHDGHLFSGSSSDPSAFPIVDNLPPYTRYPEAPPQGSLQDSRRTSSGGRRTGSLMVTSHDVVRDNTPPTPLSTEAGHLDQSTSSNVGVRNIHGSNLHYSSSIEDVTTSNVVPALRRSSAQSHRAIIEPLEKGREKVYWRHLAQKRIGGVVPCWVASAAAVSILLMGVILGAIIGVFVGKHHNPPGDRTNDHPESEPRTISGSDVVALASLPDGLPPLDTGCFTLSPLITRNAPNECFASRSQLAAWSCSVPFAMYYLSIDRIPLQPNTTDYTVSLIAYDNRNNTRIPRYPWGAAPPVINNTTSLRLVFDTYETDQGPAWWARIPYNKTVIIEEDRMSRVLSKRRASKEDGFHYRRDFHHSTDRNSLTLRQPDGRKEVEIDGADIGAGEGDKPWICTWPNTILEIYVYPAQQSNDQHTAPPQLARYHISSMRNDKLSSGDKHSRDYPSLLSVIPSEAATSTVTVTDMISPEPSWYPSEGLPQTLDVYSQVIKIKERRLSSLGSSAATCRQVQVIDGGNNDIPILDDGGQLVELMLSEIEDDREITQRGRNHFGRSSGQTSAVSELTNCGCLWWVF